ncbi:ABC transporter permease [Arthrobacter sp. KN11-1C]|uniref:ABC transporter permease n=1 Tax=Arthrobacter sp. KN11-1C TaxID=3445774 RepID=UPI003FA04F22
MSASRTVGMVVFGLVVLLCIFVPILSPYAPDEFVAQAFQPPSPAHLFGTDAVGRDLFVRTWAGGRVNLVAAAIVTGFSLIVGTTLGTLAGSSKQRWLDGLIMRIVDAVIAFPLVILILALVVVIGTDTAWGPAPAGLVASMAALMSVMWAGYARMARGQSLAMRDSDFILATRVSGLSNGRIVLRHIAPGVGRITLALAVSDIILVVVILSSLPFLGAGVQPPAPEWGSIMYEGRGYLRNAWWITLLPGAVVAITGLALSFVADSLLDARSKK